jgi:hypothetical protein
MHSSFPIFNRQLTWIFSLVSLFWKKKNRLMRFSWEVKGSQHVRLIALLPSVSWLSRRCGSLDVRQPHGPSRPVTGIALLFFYEITLCVWVTFECLTQSLCNLVFISWHLRVGIATGYELDEQGGGSSSPGRVKNFHFSISSRPALGSTQPPIKWVPGALSQG